MTPIRVETSETRRIVDENGILQKVNMKIQQRLLEPVNFFGGQLSFDDRRYLRDTLECSDNFKKIFYVVLSDVNLDDPNTLENLEQIFRRYEEKSDFEPHYILMGNFRSKQYYFDPTDKDTASSWTDRLCTLRSLLGDFKHTTSNNKM